MKPMIEFCISNLANGSQAALEKLAKDPNLDIIEYGCLSYCGKCYQSFYALVNGKAVTGSDYDELVENIYQFLEENSLY
ncbi:YuzB family protein [Virgibacillus sp. 6R]|uniref:YuzB family protein n=1 Tax=Metabacillus sp. 22489 TaxID=3453928 RepID=UPI00119E01CF